MSIYSEIVSADRATIRFPQSSMVTKNSKAVEVVAAGFYDQKNKKVLGFFLEGINICIGGLLRTANRPNVALAATVMAC